VVHGGTDFTGPVLITDAVRERLAGLTDLAPLHQPKSLAALDAVSAFLPDVPAVASAGPPNSSAGGICGSSPVTSAPARPSRRW
jgi:hypothetical protein